jgi:hypothetical protein
MSEFCRVIRCRPDAEATWEPDTRPVKIRCASATIGRICGGTVAPSFAVTRRRDELRHDAGMGSRLLRRRLVRSDVFIQGLTQDEVEAICDAKRNGLFFSEDEDLSGYEDEPEEDWCDEDDGDPMWE